MLTLKDLKTMKPHTVFAKGMFLDAPGAVNLANTGTMCKFVAVRGEIEDWAIYTDNPHSPLEDMNELARMGDKLSNKEYIKMIVPCDEEAMEAYRL
jgi:hypothetical protein